MERVGHQLGPHGHVRAAGRRALRLVRRAVLRPVNAAAELVFDRRMGVRTRGLVHNAAALAPRSIGGDPEPYEAAHLLWWRKLHSTIPVDRGAATFVDLGAGRGRAVVLAAQMGYRRVIGVELDEQLAAEAEENVRRWRSRRGTARGIAQEVSIVQGDAAAYRPVGGPTVIWLYNAFGATTLRHVLRTVCADRRAPGDELFLAYFNPVHVSVVDEFPRLAIHTRAKRWAVYRLKGDCESR